jgi:DNA (cytosine-5)-methyltransferase 1
MTHGSLFSGIGGFDLAAEWMGWENKFHCEWNPFGQKVLHHYFPNAEQFTDITKTDFTKYANRIDILTGGFPCQPYSSAGKRLGKEDERHLWPEMLRAIREIQPRWVVGENVLGLVNWNGGLVFNEVQTDLETQGYEVQPYVLPAVSVNAPHRRDRVWFVAYSTRFSNRANQLSSIRCEDAKVDRQRSHTIYNAFRPNGIEGITSDTSCRGISGYGRESEREQIQTAEFNKDNSKQFRRMDWTKFPTVSPIRYGNDGIPDRLDSITFSKWRNESIKAGGNAIVPQVVYQIFKTIEQYENLNAWTSQ